MKLCKIALDVANNNSAIASVLYDVSEDGKTRNRIPGTARLWTDSGAKQRNSVLILSVILYERENTGRISRDCYGYDALNIIKDSDTKLKARENIKYRFFVEDDPYSNAEDFTNLTRYLLDCIQFDSDTQPDACEIWLSHPVICDEDNLFHLENIINDALSNHSIHCQSIHFINEAECAFRFALSDKKVKTTIYNTLRVKNKAIALVCDIGGSTMELSLYCFTRNGKNIQHKTQAILRATDGAGRGLGSHAMDTVLRNKLTGTNGIDVLDKEKLKQIDSSLLMLRWITPLKEDLNNRLRKGKAGSLNSIHAIAVPEKLMQNETVTKQQFEQWCSGYTAAVCKQIERLAKQAGIAPMEIDLAILTGGGCELYPIETSIRELMKPGSGSKACVLRPNDPSGILDGRIIKENNPDYYNGLCPKEELASLACVLGNLAEKVILTLPPKDSDNKSDKDNPIHPKGDGTSQKSNAAQDTDNRKAWHIVGTFGNNLYIVLDSLYYGLVDKQGKIVLECGYDSIRDDSNNGIYDGLSLISIPKDNAYRYGLIDKNGRIVVPCRWDDIRAFSEGFSVVERNGRYGYINNRGRIITDCIWDRAYSFSEGRAAVKKNGLYGYIDQNGILAIPAIWEDATNFENGFAEVKKTKHKFSHSVEEEFLIDQNGKIIRKLR